jgi:hypothetical protein
MEHIAMHSREFRYYPKINPEQKTELLESVSILDTAEWTALYAEVTKHPLTSATGQDQQQVEMWAAALNPLLNHAQTICDTIHKPIAIKPNAAHKPYKPRKLDAELQQHRNIIELIHAAQEHATAADSTPYIKEKIKNICPLKMWHRVSDTTQPLHQQRLR